VAEVQRPAFQAHSPCSTLMTGEALLVQSPCQSRSFAREFVAMSHPRYMSRSLFLTAAVAVVSLLLASGPAAADRRPSQDRAAAAKREKQERAARKACLDGDYTQGVSILSDLFVDSEDPIYIFNQARCFQQNGRYGDAVVRFEEYLRTADANMNASDKAAAEKHLADCREKVAQERGSSTSQPATLALPPPTPEPAPTPALAPQPPTSSVVNTAPQRGRHLLTAGIITGAVGVAAVAGGVVMALKANSMANEMEGEVGSYSPGKENDQKRYKTLSWVGYGVGAACVATGAILIGVGISSRSSSGTSTSTDLALVPAVSPRQVGAMLTGGF